MSETTSVRMPNLGAEASAGVVVAWLRAVGDTVASGEILAEIETEKATVELESPVAGRISEILQPVGTEVPSGEILIVIVSD